MIKTFKHYFLREQAEGRNIVLFPGSFKPPHKGHFQLIENFKKMAGDKGVVNVIVTDPSPKSRRRTPSGKYVPGQVAADILQRYVNEFGLRDVNIKVAKNAVGDVYDFVREQAQPGDNIMVGVGGKGDDKARYSGILKNVPEGINVNIEVADVIGSDSGEAISASQFREVLDNPTPETILPYIPERLRDNKSLVQYVVEQLSNLPSD